MQKPSAACSAVDCLVGREEPASGLPAPREHALRLVPSQGKLWAPSLRPGLVPRERLVARLRDASEAAVVLVVAPAGYGKTTLLAQWADADARPFAWRSLSEADSDPAVLLRSLALVLDSLEPLDARTFAELSFSEADLTSVLLPRLSRVLAACSRPFVLALDDVHLLHGAGAAAVLRVLAEHIPPGSRLVLAGRRDPPLPIARMRANRRLLRISAESLTMTVAEGTALLRAAGLQLEPYLGKTLVLRTEGWPAGLYLAALALRDERDPAEAAERFGGDDRLVADYLRDEVMRSLTDRGRDFLMRTSVLDVLSGPVCDAVLECSGCGPLLEEFARANLFVVPLDRRGEWYRYHGLFRDMLRSELRHLDPELERVVHGRASTWLEEHDDPDAAIEHARARGDTPRAAALMWSNTPAYLDTGRATTVARWLDLYTPDEIAAHSPLALTAAWWSLTAGHTEAIEHWASVAERDPTQDQLPDGTPLRSAVALLRALVGKDGLTRVGQDARLAFELDRSDSPYRAIARLLEGGALRLLGERDLARARLEEGVRLAAVVLPPTEAQCLHQLALLAIDEGAWSEAETLVGRAMRLVDQHVLRDRPAMAGVHAAAALLLARRGATNEAQDDSKHALWLLEMLTDVAGWFVVETRLLLARTSLLTGDVATAQTLLRDAKRLLGRYPDAGTLHERLREVERTTDASAMPVGLTATPLTPAEMRVLRYLPTHLSFAAIADELFVSRNTVKTQAIAVYRKLGVSSRALAVEGARELGLIEE